MRKAGMKDHGETLSAGSTLPRLENAGIDAWIIRLFDSIEESNMNWITALMRECEAALGDDLIDLVPSYTTVLVHYDCQQRDALQIRALLSSILSRLQPDEAAENLPIHELPVWYDISVGPELERLSQVSNLGYPQVIQIHSEHLYRVFALGFAPGFAFMGSLPEALELPRLETPRTRVPAGSVAIAGRQTSAYPQASPGGWNLIGRTPVRLFDRDRDGMSLLQVGDAVRFIPVSKEEFIRLGGDPTPVVRDRVQGGVQ
ncbi:5-oxoprolinase subunit PxpB [Nitrincola alkalilacustris]|uniref:5-oxoprolinase subunit PxpB n=1 Tax=Nitrincola alkalilacustris TaxID=1571224 RepID=UPI001F0F2E67|nr:5-oxoprolinase subunit PxpB [Nitrincola alkalilacustris]